LTIGYDSEADADDVAKGCFLYVCHVPTISGPIASALM
jgi:hypothetical protein